MSGRALADGVRPGMDHGLYPFSPIPARAPLAWPGGARLAFVPIVHLEHWPLEPTQGAHADPRFADRYGRFHPDYRTQTWREYGLRIGVFRLFEVFDRHGMTGTLAAGANAIAHAPVIVEEALKRGWEVVAHGVSADQMVTAAMSAEEEAALIEQSLEAVERVTGTRPAGWIAQDHGESTRSLDLLRDAGVSWVAHWPNDDQPYRMTNGIVSVPRLSELDDVECLWHRRVPSPRWPGLVTEAAARLAGEGGRCLVIGLHPWLSGMPHRIRYLEAAIGTLAGMDGVWRCTAGEIAAHFDALHGEAVA